MLIPACSMATAALVLLVAMVKADFSAFFLQDEAIISSTGSSIVEAFALSSFPKRNSISKVVVVAAAASETEPEPDSAAAAAAAASFDKTSTGSSSSSSNIHKHDIAGMDIHANIVLRAPTLEERGKGGVDVVGNRKIKALEVIARIPRSLIISSVDTTNRAIEAAAQARNLSWVTDLTAATLVALHPTREELLASAASTEQQQQQQQQQQNTTATATNTPIVDVVRAKQDWIASWTAGGWATNGSDLGPSDVNFGSKDVTGSLMATGSDLDHEIYAKFRMPCHPCLFRASRGLQVLTNCTEEAARHTLTSRGFTYRSLRDPLQELVLVSKPRPKGSVREKRCWDVADTVSRVLSRATTIDVAIINDPTPKEKTLLEMLLAADADNDNDDDDDATDNNDDVEDDDDDDDDDDDNTVIVTTHAIVPIHERLEHSVHENSKLVANHDSDEILLIATRDIDGGEAITRNYNTSPRLPNDGSDTGSALHLLTQFGLPPSSWP